MTKLLIILKIIFALPFKSITKETKEAIQIYKKNGEDGKWTPEEARSFVNAIFDIVEAIFPGAVKIFESIK